MDLSNVYFPSLLLQPWQSYWSTDTPTPWEPPTVRLETATVIGTTNGSVDSFLGIPYALPPVGNLRLNLPQVRTSYNGTLNATAWGNQCIQQESGFAPVESEELKQDLFAYLAPFYSKRVVPQSEDCLNLNVIRPAVTDGAKLPVLVWFYGGGYVLGSNSVTNLDGATVVQKSIDMGEPIIYVAINYRLNAFGFLGGKEVKEAGVGNLGLQDQRAALRWLNKYISAFGGDENKVTIWGQSAGAGSVELQMYTNEGDTEGLFRAAIMNSPYVGHVGDIAKAQATYDFVVDRVGCSGAEGTLECLRSVPAEALHDAANDTPNSPGFLSPYMPYADGVFLAMPPREYIEHGKLANVPFIIGTTKDEGTLFACGAPNITTDDDFAKLIERSWFRGARPEDLRATLELYPSDPAAGSPFDTGDAYAFASQYKRIAALHGDLWYQSPRRAILDKCSSSHTAYNFMVARDAFAGLGKAHGTDVALAFGPSDMTEYFIRFVRTLDPNAADGSAVRWPRYDTRDRLTLQFNNANEGGDPVDMTADIDRMEAMREVYSLSLRFQL